MGDVRKLYPTEHLTAADVEASGDGAPLVIKACEIGAVRGAAGKTKQVLVLRFAGMTKFLRCNKTTAIRTLAAAWGPETDAWKGRSVRLTLAECPKTSLNPSGKCIVAIPVDEKAGDDLSLPPDAARELEDGR